MGKAFVLAMVLLALPLARQAESSEASCRRKDKAGCLKALETLEAAGKLARARDLAKRACDWERAFCSYYIHIAQVRMDSFWKWPKGRDLPMGEKLRPAPRELIDYLADLHEIHKLPGTPRAPKKPDPDFEADVRKAILDLPPQVLVRTNPYVVGIFVVEGLSSSALAIEVGRGQEVVGGLVLLDAVALNRKANEWATWKENLPYSAPADREIDVKIEEPATDTRSSAIRFALLHQLGHVFPAARRILPPGDALPDAETVPRYPFLALSWSVNESEYLSSFGQVPFYDVGEERIPTGKLGDLYAKLSNSGFTSLYAAVGPEDDFAESFTTYMHTVVAGRPYQVRIKAGAGSAPVTLGACWEEKRCSAKRAVLEKVLELGARP